MTHGRSPCLANEAPLSMEKSLCLAKRNERSNNDCGKNS